MNDRTRAVELRSAGKSLSEICVDLGKPKSTVYGWIRGVELPQELKAQLFQRSRGRRTKSTLGVPIQTAVIDGDYNSKEIGDNSVAQILAAFKDASLVVLLPFGDNCRYDLVVDEEGQFIRVQCKTARLCGATAKFSTCSVNWNTGKHTSYRGQVEVFAVYLRETKQVFILNADKAPANQGTLRLSQEGALKGPKNRSRMGCDHLFTGEGSLLAYP